MSNSRFITPNTSMTIAATMTGATMRIRGMPAAIKAVISLCRWIHVTVNMADISASRPLV